MRQLRQTDIDRLLLFLREAYALCDLTTFPAQIFTALRRLVPTEIISYNEVNLRRRRITWVMDPVEASFPGDNAAFARYLPEHPVIRYYEQAGDGPALQISDFLSQRQFHHLYLYQEFYRRLSVEHQIAIGLAVGAPLVIGIALSRPHTRFSERERLLLELARPHLMQAYRNAEILTVTEHAVDASQAGLVRVNRAGQILAATPHAERWLASSLGRPLPASDLPDTVAAWFRQQEQSLNGKSEGAALASPLVVECGDQRLSVNLLAPGKSSDHYGLLLQRRDAGPSLEALVALGLTRRGAEVLYWVARGKTNAEIAELLVLSPRTVEKHLEKVYQRLGVETRASAAARAFEATRERGA